MVVIVLIHSLEHELLYSRLMDPNHIPEHLECCDRNPNVKDRLFGFELKVYHFLVNKLERLRKK